MDKELDITTAPVQEVYFDYELRALSSFPDDFALKLRPIVARAFAAGAVTGASHGILLAAKWRSHDDCQKQADALLDECAALLELIK